MSIWNLVVGDPNNKELAKVKPIIDKINKLEPEISKLSDEDIRAKTEEFKKRIAESEDIKQALDEILPEAFAVAREASKRVLGMRHFDVQLIGGVVLHQGRISEMRTGEGKTLVATLALYLNALAGKGAHLVTVNDYLARRDACWMGRIYTFLGLSCGILNHEKSYLVDPKIWDPKKSQDEPETVEVRRKEAYAADITYGTNNEYGFDYLRDNMATDLGQLSQRDYFYAIVDEVDSILIDEARTPLIISAPAEESDEMYRTFARLVPNLREEVDYTVDEKMRAVSITDDGISKMERMLGVKNIYDRKGIKLVHHLEQALKAEMLFKLDRDYVVRDGEVIIVDEFTGRLMFGRRYSEGLHQAIEAKERVEIKKESITLATITFQNYFRMYEKLAGMTGTALTEAEEFSNIYKLDVLSIPTNKPMIRTDLVDKIYKNEKGKFEAIAQEIEERNKAGQPVLVGTISIEKNEMLAEMLKRRGVKHEVLNAKHHEREALIIAEAGKVGAVTIATNMAGRGVDIILGGSMPEKVGKVEADYEGDLVLWQKEHNKVLDLGGLHVIGTERHESRRIDNQLRGRAGRQGDPGSSQFFLSMEDDLMRIFGSDKIKSMMNVLQVPENLPLENKMLARAIASAQKKVEGHNFDIRKHVLEYDDVVNKHREAIYRLRREILDGKDVKDEILEMIEETVEALINTHCLGQKNEWGIKEFLQNYYAVMPKENSKLEFEIDRLDNKDELLDKALEEIAQIYAKREQDITEVNMRHIERLIYLRVIDNLWVMHIDAIDELRTGIGLRGYGQRDPLIEFKHEAYKMYQELLSAIRSEIAHLIFKVQLAERPKEDEKEESGEAGQNKFIGKNIGRNDPCPCGSGKKYKKCCGKNK